MASHNQSSMALISNTKWLPNTANKETNTMEITPNSFKPYRTISRQRSSGQISSGRHNRTITNTKHRLPLKLLHHSGNQQTQAYIRLPKDQQFYSMLTLQNGGCPSVAGYYRGERFHLQIRPQRCICGDSNTPKLQEVFDLSKSVQDISVQDTSIWHECQSEGFQQVDKICNRTNETIGDSTCVLPRRYLHSEVNENRSYESHSESSITFRTSGFLDKLSKKCTNSVTTAGVLGICVQYEDHENLCANQKINEIDETFEASHEPPTHSVQLQMVCQFDGENDLDDSSDWRSLASSSSYAERSSNKFISSPSELGRTNDFITREQERIGMVERMD
jgi:hypothetical protein